MSMPQYPADPPSAPGSTAEHSGDYVRPQRTNGFAVASLVLGIIWLFWLGSILALIFGFVAKSQIDRSAGRQSGGGLAIAGIVLGCIGIGTLLLVLAFGNLSFHAG